LRRPRFSIADKKLIILSAMMKVNQLDHVALHVADVEISIRFYRDVMCLPPMDRPAFSFPGAWFRLGNTQELHLIGDREVPVQSHHRGGHFALAVESLDEWEAHLDQMEAVRLPRKTRPDGATQTFVCDPDGNWIELCAAPNG
jgi:catechol 2,3-dioxygenase-like lactoylglutathione lyase family enzyme